MEEVTTGTDTEVSKTEEVVAPVKRGPQRVFGMVKKGGAAVTFRQAQVMSLLVRGLMNRDIAVILGIKEKTVKYHMTAIFKNKYFLELGIKRRGQLIHHMLTLGEV